MYYHEIVEVVQDKLPVKFIIHPNKDTKVLEHWHRSFEISYTYMGSIDEFTISGQRYTTKPGDLLVINSGEIHAVNSQKESDSNSLIVTVIFPYSFMESLIPDFKYRWYYLPEVSLMSRKQVEDLNICYDVLDRLIKQKKEPTELGLIEMVADIYYFIYRLTTSFSSIHSKKCFLGESTMSERINDVIDYIQNNYQERLSIESLSKEFFLSEGYFSRMFKCYMDMSVMQYVRQVRLNNAYNLIVSTNLLLSDVAINCGFPTYKALCTSFKNSYGVTPKRYRKLKK